MSENKNTNFAISLDYNNKHLLKFPNYRNIKLN